MNPEKRSFKERVVNIFGINMFPELTNPETYGCLIVFICTAFYPPKQHNRLNDYAELEKCQESFVSFRLIGQLF